VVGDIAPSGEATVREIERAGGTAIFVPTDVTRPDEVHALVGAAHERYGRLDAAVNAAGVEGPSAVTTELPTADWTRVIAVNLTGTWLCLREEIPAMVASGGGAIVNLASVGGVAGYAGSSAYAASKHRVVGLTRSAALEYAAQGVRINAVCPGAVDTPMLDRTTGGDAERRRRLVASKPIGRLATPEEVAGIAVWLCGDAAAYIVGHALVVDGGMLAGRPLAAPEVRSPSASSRRPRRSSSR